MHIANRDDGSHGSVQDPDQDREKDGDVADLCSSTDSTDGLAVAAGGVPSIPSDGLRPCPPTCPFHVKHDRFATLR